MRYRLRPSGPRRLPDERDPDTDASTVTVSTLRCRTRSIGMRSPLLDGSGRDKLPHSDVRSRQNPDARTTLARLRFPSARASSMAAVDTEFGEAHSGPGSYAHPRPFARSGGRGRHRTNGVSEGEDTGDVIRIRGPVGVAPRCHNRRDAT